MIYSVQHENKPHTSLPIVPALLLILLIAALLKRMLAGRFVVWRYPETGTLSEAVEFAEVLAHLVSTRTPSWFAAMRSDTQYNLG